MQSTNNLIIATRESPLALWQANFVKNRLQDLHPELSIQLLGMTTKADELLSTPLYKVGGKGLFVKELEEALLTKKADIAVHSMKDVPMNLPDGLCVPVMCEREDARDVFVSNEFSSFEELPLNAIVGTSSLRRQSQLLALRRDLKTAFLRGNVNTRLIKLDNKEFSAIILAAAGLKRLNEEKRIRSYLTFEQSLPAAGQGVLGIECRLEDERTQALIASLNHIHTFFAVTAERALCRKLGGGCHVPIAAFAEVSDNQIQLRGLVGAVDGTRIVRTHLTDTVQRANELGLAAATDLLQQGAQELLDAAVK